MNKIPGFQEFLVLVDIFQYDPDVCAKINIILKYLDICQLLKVCLFKFVKKNTYIINTYNYMCTEAGENKYVHPKHIIQI